MLRIGMLTSGGDCQALNAAMRGVVKGICSKRDDVEIYGFQEGYKGLIYSNFKMLTSRDFSGILTLGGTILGTSRQPFKLMRVPDENGLDKVEAMKHTYHKLNLDCLVILGGNGTHKTANMLREEGLNIITLPKTIDNDLWGTDMTFGFQSAVDIATDTIDKIHTTATSHSRVFIIEVMGHKVGHVTLHAGIAGGADIILLPELPYKMRNLGNVIIDRLKRGKPYSIVVVAEGIHTDADSRKRAGEYIAQEIEYETGFETRETVLGYLQRGGTPTSFDRNLATLMGGHAVELIADRRFGRMVTLQGDTISSIPLTDVAGKVKLVTPDADLIVQGKRMGVCFG